MRNIAVATVLLLLLLTGAWLVLGGEAPRAAGPAETGPRAQVVAVEGASPQAEEPAEARRAPHRASRAEREALRRRILDAMEGRGGAGEEPRPGAQEDAAEAEARRRKSSAAGPAEEAPTPGGLIDRGGKHGYLLKVMNEDLMPLVDECYALVRASKPDLKGNLKLDVELIGDQELGGVIESIERRHDSELTDPALDECVRESMFSITLPPPPAGGRDAISLDLRLEPEPEGKGA